MLRNFRPSKTYSPGRKLNAVKELTVFTSSCGGFGMRVINNACEAHG